MNTRDEIAAANQRLWDEEVKAQGGYTRPWLDLDVSMIHRYVAGELVPAPYPYHAIYPAESLHGVQGKDVLCLASGGGQQSAVFSLLGARVTVVDLCQGQLAGDRTAAQHYGYSVNTIQADMRDLSCLDADSFDLVHQLYSMSWVPDAREVYEEVARVIRVDGTYQVGHRQPAIAMVAWNGESYRIDRPYLEKMERGDKGEYDFRHYMDQIFNGLIDTGFTIQRVHEGPYSRHDDYLNAECGTWNHQMGYVGGDFVVVATKI